MGCKWRIWAMKKCSRCTTRSITSLKDDGAEAKDPAPCCSGGAASINAGWEPVDDGACECAGNAPAKSRINKTEPTWKIRIETFWDRIMPTEKQCVKRR